VGRCSISTSSFGSHTCVASTPLHELFRFGFAVYYFLFFLHFLGVFCKWAGSTGCYGWIGGGGRMLWGAWPVAFACAPHN